VTRRLLVAVLLLGLLLGCGTGPSDQAEEAPVESPSDSPSDSPSESPSSTPSDGAADAAVADLAAHLGIEPEAVQVVAVEEVTWRDGSLGCAERGMVYTQALVDGARITLRAEGVEHEYHQGASGTPIRCADPTE
jgi:hypothetical protein